MLCDDESPATANQWLSCWVSLINIPYNVAFLKRLSTLRFMHNASLIPPYSAVIFLLI